MKCLSNIRGDCVPVLAAKRTNEKDRAKGDETHLLLNAVPRRLENQAQVSTFKYPPVHVRLSARNQNLVNVETEPVELVLQSILHCKVNIPKPLMELLGYYNNVSTGCSCTLLCEMKAYARARRRLTNKK
ncbi:hypothetical protein G5I_05942 [Acromyrmex echinatior]|uniref:Uncharacterized protein n=1 Tax=Acromyrmex echinatior TaxID=103372 RepID=F4WJR0_ACREC|nr:hypothetical protein G5I_05942 [Acromyrmex echinatior]